MVDQFAAFFIIMPFIVDANEIAIINFIGKHKRLSQHSFKMPILLTYYTNSNYREQFL